VLTAPRLRRGDRVKFVSPASPPDRDKVANGARILESWGLTVEIGAHVFDRWGHFLAGSDEDRLADINEALRDPGVRAVFSTTGGKGAYRIAHALDFAAAIRDPKPLIGYSEITSTTATMLPIICDGLLWKQSRLRFARTRAKSPRTLSLTERQLGF
jgi:muramoyltetrapeptide carboxypeptidase